MKKLLILSLTLLLTLTAHAQRERYSVSLRTYAGMNFTNVSNAVIKDNVVLDTKTKPGFVMGADWEYQMDNTFAISGGLAYSQMGFKTSTGKYAGIDYIMLPVLFHAYFLHGFGLHAGVQAGVNIKTNKLIEDNVGKMGAGVVVGVSYEYKRFVLGGQYFSDFAVTSVEENKTASRNKGFSVTLGYRFELFKRKLKENKTDNHIHMPTLDI